MAKTLSASFSAPEQVKSGRPYSAKLELNLPSGLQAVGSITSQPLEYPQPQPTDSWRPLDGTVLERIMPANTNNKNELLMATIGITNTARSNLMGITFLTRRLNVVPNIDEPADIKTANAEKIKDGKTAKMLKKNRLCRVTISLVASKCFTTRTYRVQTRPLIFQLHIYQATTIKNLTTRILQVLRQTSRNELEDKASTTQVDHSRYGSALPFC